jgi:hypothetical protein
MQLRMSFALSVFCLLMPTLSLAEDRGIRVSSAEKAGLSEYNTNNLHALVIGIDQYRHWRPLRCAVNDASSVADVLTRHYGFKTQVLKNADATREKIIKTIDSYSDLGPADCLVIYFAGHGWLDKDKRGYWIPADARQNEVADYVPNSQLVHDYFGKYKVKHLLVISDSCFSGALLRGAEEVRSADWQMPSAFAKPSRWIITSGDLNPVPDGTGEHSPFANRILQYLQFERPSFGVRDLYDYVRKNMGQGSDPIAEPLRTDTHMPGGEFIFCRLDKPLESGGVRPPVIHHATIRVYSPVAGTLSLDGRVSWPIAADQTLRITDLREGQHVMEVVTATGERWRETVDARVGDIPIARAVFRATPPPTTGAILLHSSRAGTAVLDGTRAYDIYPGNPTIVPGLSTGNHEVYATSGKLTWRDHVAVAANETSNVKVEWELPTEPWYIGPRIGFSPLSGVVGMELQILQIGINVGYITAGGNSIQSAGLKYYFQQDYNTWFAGIGFFRLNCPRPDREDMMDRRELTTLLTGYRWFRKNGWTVSVGGGISYFNFVTEPQEGDLFHIREEDKGVWPMGELVLGYSF